MRIDFIPDPALYPFTSRWFDSSRGRVHYVDEGSGPVIMFFHGNPTWSFLYRYIVTGLRDQFRCIAADYLGFGLSERPVWVQLPDRGARPGDGRTGRSSRPRRLPDHGQDWGGPISMAVDVARAGRVRGVVLGNSWFWPAADLSTKALR
jgi:haloalkane dehalogenase